MAHQSDSTEQRDAEAIILAALSETLGQALTPTRVTLPGGAKVEVDGAASDPPVFVEVFAHQGRLRGGQFHKVSTDALKLITVREATPGARLILAFADEAAARPMLGTSWRAEALRLWNIEVVVVDIDDETRRSITEAQVRQRMVNPDSA